MFIYFGVLLVLQNVIISSGFTTSSDWDKEWTKHHHNFEIVDILNRVHAKCPKVTYLYNLTSPFANETVFGNKLNVITFGSKPKVHTPGIPEFKYIANMHGNEVVGREMLLRLIVEMCEKYKAGDKMFKKLIENTRIHIMPTMNPDGWSVAVGEKKHQLLGRRNGNNVDLNRNFPDLDNVVFKHMEDGGPLDHLLPYVDIDISKLEPETLMIMTWLERIPFVLSANLHGGDLVSNYPYDTSPSGESILSKTPDHSLFVELSQEYADENRRMWSNKIKCDPNDFDHGITNGADWYAVDGGMQDYNYLATNCYEITVEMSCDKYPPGNQLPQFWKYNRDALYNYMLQIHRGVKGMVYADNPAGLVPLDGATISVFNITETGKVKPILHNVRSNTDGDYYRLLNQGEYVILASKEGFDPAISCVNVQKKPEWDDGDFSTAKQRFFVLAPQSDTELIDGEATLRAPSLSSRPQLRHMLRQPDENIVHSSDRLDAACVKVFERMMENKNSEASDWMLRWARNL